MVLLEICIDSFPSAKNAFNGGADRLEVCGALALGGLTPTSGLLKQIKASFPEFPCFCMLRPRGGVFVYSKAEIETLLRDCDELKSAGADGFVFGALNSDGTLDVETCKLVLAACSPLPVTLHRAFDYCSDWKTSLALAVEMGFKAVLSSGQRATAVQGIDILSQMISAYPQITVIAGSGINPENAKEILRNLPLLGGIHGSASVKIPSKFGYVASDFRMGSNDYSDHTKETCEHTVAKLAKAAHL
ncbi:hypothetical protein L596_019076 [Steinernema carpocapsae]|uniref:Copper homeostasis protein cutC homolog n=1 Tax=Steinernema carpocapsae TaxID=34508 RepID=A0A4U5N6L6_STECR|nr:hypothetical protein L596_019076 [Steinernema carpocapsae]